MAFKQLNPNLKIAGFFLATVGNVITGKIVKRIETDKSKGTGAYFLIEITEPCKIETADPKNPKKKVQKLAKVGEGVALSESACLKALNEHVGALVRVTFEGTTPSKKFVGKDVKLFKIEVDDGTPF